MPRKAKANKTSRLSSKQQRLNHLQLVQNNHLAMSDGPKKRTWSKHDILSVQPLTSNQRQYFDLYNQHLFVSGFGCPGTGKTFLSMYLALNDIIDKNNEYDQLIIVRSAVSTREIGHLPGDITEKTSVYESPYQSACQTLFEKASTYQDMKDAGLIKFITTSFIRGDTWDNSIIIIDEAQNMTWHELNSVITRVGEDSKLIVIGDTKQCDFTRKTEQSGFSQFLKVADNMNYFGIVEFTEEDIVRSEFVKQWITTCRSLNLL